ncbi:hypothetical protein, partial [uncultured Corynebacterium sp.]|uniref:hypothetical protein n=1 Tax=uncultured Corynebacterium sp. TaxID=159447 RepID=UPI0025E8EBBF
MPTSQAQASRPASVSRYGITHSSASGATSRPVTGAVAASKVFAKPKTHPCFRYGTTCWITVCSAASTAGIRVITSHAPRRKSQPASRMVNRAPTTPTAAAHSNMVRTGLRPSPLTATSPPPTKSPVAATAKPMPQP